MNNFGPFLAQNYASLSQDLLQGIFSNLQHDKTQQVNISNLSEISSKILFGPNGQFWPNCDPKLWKLISQDSVKGFFQA